MTYLHMVPPDPRGRNHSTNWKHRYSRMAASIDYRWAILMRGIEKSLRFDHEGRTTYGLEPPGVERKFQYIPEDRNREGHWLPLVEDQSVAEPVEATAPEPAPVPAKKKKRAPKKRDQVHDWRLLARALHNLPRRNVLQRDVTAAVKASGVPKNYGPIIFLCTRTYMKHMKSQAKAVSRSHVLDMILMHHWVLFSSSIWKAMKSKCGRIKRAEVRDMIRIRTESEYAKFIRARTRKTRKTKVQSASNTK